MYTIERCQVLLPICACCLIHKAHQIRPNITVGVIVQEKHPRRYCHVTLWYLHKCSFGPIQANIDISEVLRRAYFSISAFWHLPSSHKPRQQ